LIGLAPIIAPALAGWAGVRGHAIFWIGIAFTVSALVPLAFTQKERAGAPRAEDAHQHNHQPGGRDGIFKVGIVIALLGGMIEAALSGLFPLFAQGRDLTVENTADLLTMFGIGGLLMQYAVGWLADHKGLAYAATTCAAGTVLITAAMAFPLNYLALTLAVFLLGGTITAFLTLAIIASTTTTSGSLAGNVILVSMVYTGSAVVGPLLAGTAMHALRADALVWFLGAAALVMGLAVYAVGNLNKRGR
jgi:predicted MFS family arabinose efflux permease